MGDFWGIAIANPWQFAIIILSSAIALYIIGKGFTDFLAYIVKILGAIGSEFSGRALAKQGAIFNLILLILVGILEFLVLSPNLLSQLGLNIKDVNNWSSILMLLIFCLVGIWSGNFILQFSKEKNAFKDAPKQKTRLE